MTEKSAAQQPRKVSMTSTKQEMMEAYNSLLKQLQEKEKVELKPEAVIEKKKGREAIEVADALSLEGIVKEVGDLRLNIGKMLTQVSDSLQEEVQKYKKVKDAVEMREKELEEIYGIEKEARSLVALIEAQARKREEFEIEMGKEKEEIEEELGALRAEHDKEKKLFEIRQKELIEQETLRRQREKEEYEYAFKREQQLARHNFDDEKARQEKDLKFKKETQERELLEREKRVAEDEKRAAELQRRMDNLPKEIEAAVQRAVKETAEKLQAEARNREELLKKTYEGERNVFVAQIESLEKSTKDQKEQIVRLSQQLEKAYQKVEDIAVKTVGGLEAKSLLAAQQMESQIKRSAGQEK